MKIEFTLPERLAGFAAASARPGETACIVFMELSSSEDGEHFNARIEQMDGCLFSRIPGLTRPELVGSLFIVMRHDLTATAWVNEPVTGTVRVRSDVASGSPATLDDILNVDRIRPPHPVDANEGIVSLMTYGWRRSLLFDFSPVLHEPIPRTYELDRQLGIQKAQLLFQQRNRISEEGWARLLEEGWFPFTYLREKAIGEVIGHAEAGWPVQEVLDCGSLDEDLHAAATKGLALFSSNVFEPHRPFLERGFERFAAGDYMSAITLLFPQIEGVLRSIQGSSGGARFTQADLIQAATPSDDVVHMMPSRFRQFLDEFCFRNFTPGATVPYVSRNTVAHGVADAGAMNRKSAAVAVLTLLQIALFSAR